MIGVCSECECHNGPGYPCSVPGGCGHLHRGEDGPPANRCLTHHPPRPGQAWRLADPGYRTCRGCYDRIHGWLSPLTLDDDHWPDGIPGLYALLNAAPGHGEVIRRGPGFGSSAPASNHVIAMRDRRSKPCEVARDGVEYIWDETAEDAYPRLPPGVQGPERRPGSYVTKRDVWRGADGKLYAEDPKPVRSVPHTLGGWVQMVAEERDMTPGTGSVADLCAWLDRNLDWIGRQDWVTDLADDLQQLHRQLKLPAGGNARRPVGSCPNTIDEGEHTRTCDTPLFAPLRGDTIQCGGCDREWTRREWLRLGDLLEAS